MAAATVAVVDAEVAAIAIAAAEAGDLGDRWNAGLKARALGTSRNKSATELADLSGRMFLRDAFPLA